MPPRRMKKVRRLQVQEKVQGADGFLGHREAGVQFLDDRVTAELASKLDSSALALSPSQELASRDASISGLQASKADASALTAYAPQSAVDTSSKVGSKIAAALLDAVTAAALDAALAGKAHASALAALLSTVDGLDTPLEVDTKIANAMLGLATEAFVAAQLASRDASVSALQGRHDSFVGCSGKMYLLRFGAHGQTSTASRSWTQPWRPATRLGHGLRPAALRVQHAHRDQHLRLLGRFDADEELGGLEQGADFQEQRGVRQRTGAAAAGQPERAGLPGAGQRGAPVRAHMINDKALVQTKGLSTHQRNPGCLVMVATRATWSATQASLTCRTVGSKQLFDSVEAKQHKRPDINGDLRLGFASDDFAGTKWKNLTGVARWSDGAEMVTLNYSRLTSVLWGVCKGCVVACFLQLIWLKMSGSIDATWPP